MSTETRLEQSSSAPEDTYAIGVKIGRQLKGGETIELVSDLGGGKTTFVGGLAEGAGSQDEVASPSFTLNRIYQAPSLNIHHYDFFRLEEAGIMADELGESLQDKGVVTVVEWAKALKSILPRGRLVIEFIVGNSENTRRLNLSAPSELSYLLSELKP